MASGVFHHFRANRGTMTGSGLAHAAADEPAVRSVVDRVDRAWSDADAEAFAGAFTEAGTMILSGDRYFRGRPQIRGEMGAAFAGPLKGTRLTGWIVDLRLLAPGVAVVTTEGGILLPGETGVDRERALRATWVVVEELGQWLVAAYQNGRVADGRPPSGPRGAPES
jgi:uncharacterized protein (TIGR02246 family)